MKIFSFMKIIFKMGLSDVQNLMKMTPCICVTVANGKLTIFNIEQIFGSSILDFSVSLFKYFQRKKII